MGRLTKVEITEAEIVAEHLLSRRAKERDVTKHLRAEFGMSYTQALKIVKSVHDSWAEAAKRHHSGSLERLLLTLDEASALAFSQKDVRGVVAVERLRADVCGFTSRELQPQPIEERRDADLEKYWDDEEAMDCIATMGRPPDKLTAKERETFASIRAMKGVHSEGETLH